MISPIFTAAEARELLANHRTNAARLERAQQPLDFRPVVWFHRPGAAQAWLLTEADPESRLAYGLRLSPRLVPEMMFIELAELEHLAGRHLIRRQPGFNPAQPRGLAAYLIQARQAHADGLILTPSDPARCPSNPSGRCQVARPLRRATPATPRETAA